MIKCKYYCKKDKLASIKTLICPECKEQMIDTPEEFVPLEKVIV